METPDAKVLRCERRFIILEARIKQRRIKCFGDGGAERSIISRTLHEELKLDATPYKTTIMGVGGAATAVTMEREVPLHLGKKEKQVKALVCDVVPIGDILVGKIDKSCRSECAESLLVITSIGRASDIP